MASVRRRPGTKQVRRSSKKVQHGGAKRASGKAGKMVYYFGQTKTEGDASMRDLLGGKGANLAEMTSIGLPVPPGFTITTAACARYYEEGGKLPTGLMDQVRKNVKMLEKETGKVFGSHDEPAAALRALRRQGLDAGHDGHGPEPGPHRRRVAGLCESMGNERFAYDAYRRLINMFGDVVMGVEHEHFEAAFAKIKKKYKVRARHRCARRGSQGTLRGLQGGLQELHGKKPFPQDPMEQLELAIEAVFKSWNAPRAISYRRINEITGLNGTGVNVQTMVFGNMGDDSRHRRRVHPQPLHGREQVLRRVPDQRPGRGRRRRHPHAAAVAEMPKWDRAAYKQLLDIKDKLEKHYKDMQDIEFTIERGKLYMLQTRTGKRTGAAAVKIAATW
jgi:pyruvate,orthophosphate dikinase